MAENFVSNPYAYFNARNQGRPIFNGQIFVGEPDLDPTIVANQKQVTAKQEDGTKVNIPQPVSTNSGGYPVFNGSPIVLLVDGNYAIRVNDSGGNLALEQSNVNDGVPLTEVSGVSSIGNLDKLRLFEPTVDGQQASLLGHTTPGIGGGDFFFDASDTTSADNDGTIIVTPGDKRWKRPLGDMFLAEWFGVDKSLADNISAIIKAYDAAEAARYDALWLPTNGGELTITDTIPLKRGVAIRGGSTIDDQSGTVIKRADNMDAPVLATPKWFTPTLDVDTHYFVIEGITINGNRDNQTVLAEAIALWGVFVGTVLDNIFILNNFGPGLSNEYNYDYKIGLLWINGCVVGSRAVWEIDQTNVASGPIGLIDVESLFIENPSTIQGGTPQAIPANRGEGIRVGNIGRLHISNLHQEACDVNIHITHGTNEIIKVGARSSAHSGDPAKLHSDIYLSASVINLVLGPTKVFNPDASFNWIDMTPAILSTNLIPTVARNQVRWGGCNLSSPAADDFVTTGLRLMADTEQRKINTAANLYRRSYVSETDDDAYYYEKSAGAFHTQGARNGQVSEKDFSRLESFGNTGDRYTDFVPRVLVIQEVTGVSGALYVTAAGSVRIRLSGVVFEVGLTAV